VPKLHCETGGQGFFSSQIIAILAAILFPVFAKAREKARQTSCLSNLKQLGVGLQMYAQDFDERFPWHCRYTGGPDSDRNGWQGQVMPYVKNDQLFVCPSSGRTGLCGGYGYNLSRDASSVQVGCDYMALGKCPYPAETIIIGDSNGTKWIGHWTWPTVGNLDKPGRHNDGGNFCMVDGHAKWYKTTYLDRTGGLWDRSQRAW